MDNVQNLPEVHSSYRQSRTGGPVVVKQLDPKTMPGEEMNALWRKVSTQDYAFDDSTRGNPQSFVLTLVEPTTYHFLVNDSAWVMLRNAYPNSDCAIHFVLWDRAFPFRDIIEAGRQILEWAYKEKQVNRITGFIPAFNPLAKRFATMMGFKYEGTMRKSIKWKEEFYDVDIYGLLAKEFERRFQQ